MARVFVDPGHGGIDSGACGNNSRECDIALATANRVKYHLIRLGHTVIMSRDKDATISLGARTDKANLNGCDIFVSIHCNDARNIEATGIETFCYKFKYRKLADDIHNELLASKCYTVNRGVKEGNLHVLRESNMNACLIELGFIKNKKDYTYLCNNQEAFAIAISKGIQNYFGLKYIDENKKCSACQQVIK